MPTAPTEHRTSNDSTGSSTIDVAIIGAGFAGMYLLHRMRAAGMRAHVYEAGGDVGGTWYWNRYPGARCDVQSVDYSYSFDPQLDLEWEWSEKYATQPEILRYAQHVAERFDLRRDITFDTRLAAAHWDESEQRWSLTLSGALDGQPVTARNLVMATGCLSVPKDIDVPGADRFAGLTYLTGRWPHEGVDFTGRRVAVIGTGSSAIQSIPIIASQATHVTVFQRTPNFSIPAYNGPVPDDKRSAAADRAAYRHAARYSGSGVPWPVPDTSALAVSDEQRMATYEAAWQRGGIVEFLATYMDHVTSPVANELLSEFVRNKIRAVVTDPEVAEALCPKSFPIGTKRLCVDSGYYETFNKPHVRLIDLRRNGIATITASGVQMDDGEHIEVDDVVFATGFDAMTGAIVSIDITGRQGRTLREAWHAGPTTYLGLMTDGFPNLFMITGPGSPSVLSNMIVSIEQHVDWITDCLTSMRTDGFDTIEPTPTAVAGWVQHVNDFAAITLMPQANSWYMGANVPGKPRVFLPYPGGCDRYRTTCDEVVAAGYLGFTRSGDAGTTTNDGVVRRVQPDVGIMLELMAQLGLPPLESLSPADARAFSEASSGMRPPGPEVGEITDGTLPGPAGDLTYRLYRPTADVAGTGPLAVMVYFHGGGWVLGNATSDDPLCRDLCQRTGAVIISVDYRHGPEDRFPAAPDDALAAVRWVGDHAAELGVRADRIVVGGWSAGANLAAVTAQRVRDEGGPVLAGQMLLTPVTDGAVMHPSYVDNADGYILTASLMRWFWDNYAEPAERDDPKASPLRHPSLAGLPPAVVITCEFDPLRDEGDAYAGALAAAGVDVEHIRARGHIHTSLTAVDMLASGVPVRAAIADAVRRFTS